MSEIKSLIDDDIKEKIDNSAICVKFAMMSKQIEEKEQENERLKIIEEKYYLEMLDKINGYKKEIERLNNIINELEKEIDNFDVFKEFSFPLMKRWEEEQVKSSIDYEWRKAIKEPFLNKIKELKGSDKE